MRLKLSQVALRTSLAYVVGGALWILLSDRVLMALVSDPARLEKLSMLKGWFFVTVTGGLLYVVLRRGLNRWEREAAARELAQAELRRSESRIAELAVAVPGTIYSFRLRPNGDIEMPYASPKLQEMFAVAPDEIAADARNLFRFVHREDRQRLWETIETSAKTLAPWNCLFRSEHPQRGVIWIEGRSVPEREADGSILWHGLLIDATDRHRAELELARQRAELQMILDSVPALVFFKDREHRMLRVNEETLRVMGRTREQLEGQQASQTGSPYSAGYHRDEDEVLATGRPKLGIIEKLLTQRGERWMRTDKLPYRDEHGAIVGVVGFALDITDQVQAEEARLRQHLMLEAIRTAQARFIGTGDLVAPLDGLLGAVLNLTGSEFGFVAELQTDGLGRPFLKMHALTNIAWDETTRNLFARQGAGGLVFSNLKTLFGAVITTGEVVIANDPVHDSRRGGLPVGHPPLTAFMGIPLKQDGRLVGVIGLANRPGGFEERLLAEFEPLCTTFVSLIEAGREAHRRRVAELGQRQSDDRFRALVESLDEIVWSARPGEVHPTYLSPAFERICGRPVSEVVGSPAAALELIHPEDRQRVLDSIAREKSGLPENLEYRIIRPDGSVRWLWDKAVPVFDDQGTVVAVNGIGADITERKLAEASIQALTEWQRAILDNAAYAIIATNPQGVIQSFNRAAEQLLGYTAAEMVGRLTPEVFHDPAEVVARARQFSSELGIELEPGFEVFVAAARCYLPATHEWTYVSKGGSRIPVLLSVTALRRADGEITGFVGLAKDITERKQGERALEHSLSLSRAALESTAEGLLVVDLEGRIIDYNRQFQDIWQFPEALIPAGRRRDLVATGNEEEAMRFVLGRLEDPGTFIAKVQELYAHPDAESFDVLRFKDGRIVERYSIPQRIARRPVGRVWSFRDVTERHRAEENLRSAKENLEVLVEAIPDVILFKDAVGRWQITNRVARELFQVTATEWRGLTDSELGEALPGLSDRFAAWQATDAQAWDTAALAASIERVTDADGAAREFEVCKLPMFHPDGTRKALLVVARDVTERIQAEATRRDLEAQLRQAQKMEAIGQLAGGVAHDFNNLLTIIRGNATLLLETPRVSVEGAMLIREVLQATDRAAELTRQLLLFGRKSIMQAVDLDLNEVVGNLTRMLQRTLGEDIALSTDYARGLRAVHGDAGMIEQVLINLVVNARDAMPRGGKLALATSLARFDAGNLPKNPEARPGAFACLSVSDTGTGIPPEHLARIFEPFFTTKEVGKGSGLGLATVYGIVHQHGGWVDVESEPGQGTTFRVFLPVTDRTVPGPSAADEAPKPLPGGSETILVVEDEPAVRLLVVTLLKRYGYTVLAAVSGVEALKVWAAHGAEVDLLFTDVMMPDGMTGRDLARRLLEERPSLKVIFTSGYSADLAAAGAGVVDGINFLQKPFSPLQLAQVIRACLDRP